MKLATLLVVAMIGSLPALAQDPSSCNAYFQVLRSDSGTPGLRAGMDSGQKSWWDNIGKKKYPGLCLDGSVMSPDKPRYLVIWSKSKTMGQSSLRPDEAYGQSPNPLQSTAVTTRIYQPRWDQASVTIVNVQYYGSLMMPPVYFEADDHVWTLVPNSRKVLEAAVKYLSQEPVFLHKPG